MIKKMMQHAKGEERDKKGEDAAKKKLRENFEGRLIKEPPP